METKANSAIDFLENIKIERLGNYGVETSIDNRISLIRGYVKHSNWKSLEIFYRDEIEDGYLCGWQFD